MSKYAVQVLQQQRNPIYETRVDLSAVSHSINPELACYGPKCSSFSVNATLYYPNFHVYSRKVGHRLRPGVWNQWEGAKVILLTSKVMIIVRLNHVTGESKTKNKTRKKSLGTYRHHFVFGTARVVI